MTKWKNDRLRTDASRVAVTAPLFQLNRRMRVLFTTGDFFCRAANFSALSRSMYTRPNDSCRNTSRSRASDDVYGGDLFCSWRPCVWP